MFNINVNGETLTSNYPSIQQMMQIVQLYIFLKKGVQIGIHINEPNLQRELFLLEKAYDVAKNHIPFGNF